MRVMAVIPARNEAASLPRVVRELREHQPGLEILVVDDHSGDDTLEVVHSLAVPHLRLCQQAGLGSAVRAALRYAKERGVEAVVRLDADGQHPAELVERVLVPIFNDTADAAVGSRFLAATGYRQSVSRRAVQQVLAACLTRLTGQVCTDPTSGFWAFGPKALALLSRHYPTGHSEPELWLFLKRHCLRVVEIGVRMRYRESGRSTLTTGRASLAVARAMLAMLVVPLRPPARE